MNHHARRTFAAVVLGLALGNQAGASELYGIQYPEPSNLFRIDQATGTAFIVGPSGRDNLGDLTSDTRPGSERIWGVRIESNQLFEFNPLNGAATAVSTLTSPDRMVSIAFDPVGGKLYGNTSVGFGAPFDALYEINPATGGSTFIGRILFDNVYALGFDQTGKLYGVSDAANDLILINTTTGNGLRIGTLATDFAFDIASRPEDNVMFLADSFSHALYTLNTASGQTTLVGGYGANLNIVGLAFGFPGAVPEPSSLLAGAAAAGLVAGAEAWRRRRRRGAELVPPAGRPLPLGGQG